MRTLTSQHSALQAMLGWVRCNRTMKEESRPMLMMNRLCNLPLVAFYQGQPAENSPALLWNENPQLRLSIQARNRSFPFYATIMNPDDEGSNILYNHRGKDKLL